MPLSRFLFFVSKNRSRDALNLLQRYGPSKKFQCRGYMKSSKNSNRRLAAEHIVPVESQSTRSWSSSIVPTTAVLGFIGVAYLLHKNDEKRAIPKGQGHCGNVKNCLGPIIGGPFSLTDTEQRVVTEKNVLGSWVLLYFGYTSSPDVGPEQVQVMAKATDLLESKLNLKLLPVFVTIDPQRDTPAHLGAYLKEFNSKIMGLTGPVTAVRQMAQEYRVYFRKVDENGDDYLVESSHNMYLLKPNLEVARCFGTEYSGEELAEAVAKELKANAT